MKTKFKLLMIVLLIHGSSVAAEINDLDRISSLINQLPENVQLHTLNNDTASKGKWHSAMSATSGFSVQLPIPFEKWSAVIDDRMADGISATSKEGVKFLAFAIPRTKFDYFKDVRDLTSKFLGTTKHNKTRYFKFGNHKGTETKIVKPMSSVIYRFFLTDSRIYQISVEYPKSQRRKSLSISRQFFNSFRIQI